MIQKRPPTLTAVLALALCVGVAANHATAQESVYDGGLFELGDGQPPPAFPGMGNILLSSAQPGPDWEDLFDAAGAWRDDDANGVPDFQELFGGRWALFAADDVSLGSGFESTALAADGRIYNATAASDHDIGNGYAYLTTDQSGNVIVYAGAERLGSGDSYLELEFNQDHFRLGHGGYGVGAPWQVLGTRVVGDVLVQLNFAGGALGAVTLSSWDGVAWAQVETLAGESCNLAETLCAVCNAEAVDGGPWQNYDTVDDPEQISANRFIEVGVNVGALLGGPADFSTVWMRTPEDAAFGHFEEGN